MLKAEKRGKFSIFHLTWQVSAARSKRQSKSFCFKFNSKLSNSEKG